MCGGGDERRPSQNYAIANGSPILRCSDVAASHARTLWFRHHVLQAQEQRRPRFGSDANQDQAGGSMKYIGEKLSFGFFIGTWIFAYCVICAPEAMAATQDHAMEKSTALYLTFALFAVMGLFWLFIRAVSEGDEQRRIDRREYDEANGHEHH